MLIIINIEHGVPLQVEPTGNKPHAGSVSLQIILTSSWHGLQIDLCDLF